MLCGYSCCNNDGYAGLPTDFYLSLFVDIGSNCRAAVKHMGCASCHPYIHHYQTRCVRENLSYLSLHIT